MTALKIPSALLVPKIVTALRVINARLQPTGVTQPLSRLRDAEQRIKDIYTLITFGVDTSELTLTVEDALLINNYQS